MSRQDLIEQVVQTRLEQFSYDTTKDLMFGGGDLFGIIAV